MKWFLWVFVALLAVHMAYTELTAEDVNISGTAPSEDVEGNELTDLALIRIYHSVDAPGGPYAELVELDMVGVGTQFGYLHADQEQGTHCYIATAVDLEGNESEPSNEACKRIDTIAPGAPFDLRVE